MGRWASQTNHIPAYGSEFEFLTKPCQHLSEVVEEAILFVFDVKNHGTRAKGRGAPL